MANTPALLLGTLLFARLALSSGFGQSLSNGPFKFCLLESGIHFLGRFIDAEGAGDAEIGEDAAEVSNNVVAYVDR